MKALRTWMNERSKIAFTIRSKAMKAVRGFSSFFFWFIIFLFLLFLGAEFRKIYNKMCSDLGQWEFERLWIRTRPRLRCRFGALLSLLGRTEIPAKERERERELWDLDENSIILKTLIKRINLFSFFYRWVLLWACGISPTFLYFHRHEYMTPFFWFSNT